MKFVNIYACIFFLCSFGLAGSQFAHANNYKLDFGGDFELIDHTGKKFQLSDLKGKVVTLYFGFTSCGYTCPTTLANIAAALRLLEDQEGDVVPLLVTVDPARDTQERLAKYVSSFHSNMIGLTGTDDQLRKLRLRYRAPSLKRYPDDAGNYVVDHSSKIFLIDHQGGLANILAFEDAPATIASAIRKLIP